MLRNTATEINGIDPQGQTPPDEILHHPDHDGGFAVELIRARIPADAGRKRMGWELRVEKDPDGEMHVEGQYREENFQTAFSAFSYWVGQSSGEI